MKKLGIILSLIALTLVFIGCQRRPPIERVERLELVNFSPSAMYLPGQPADYTNVSVRVFLTDEVEPLTLTLGDAALSITGDKTIEDNTLSLNTDSPGLKTFYVSYSGLTVSVTYNVSGILHTNSDTWYVNLQDAIDESVSNGVIHVYPGDHAVSNPSCTGGWCALEINTPNLSIYGVDYDGNPIDDVHNIMARLIPTPVGQTSIHPDPIIYYIRGGADNLLIQGVRFEDLTTEEYIALNGFSGDIYLPDYYTGNKVMEIRDADNFILRNVSIGANRWDRPGKELHFQLYNTLESLFVWGSEINDFEISGSIIEGALAIQGGVGSNSIEESERRKIVNNITLNEIQLIGFLSGVSHWSPTIGKLTLQGNAIQYLEVLNNLTYNVDKSVFLNWIEENNFADEVGFYHFESDTTWSSVHHNYAPYNITHAAITSNLDALIHPSFRIHWHWPTWSNHVLIDENLLTWEYYAEHFISRKSAVPQICIVDTTGEDLVVTCHDRDDLVLVD